MGLHDTLEKYFDIYPEAKTVTDLYISGAKEAISHLYRGDACFVTRDILQIAMQAAEDLPDGVEFQEKDLLCPYGFLLLEDGIIVKDKQGDDFLISGFAWGLERSSALLGRECVELWFLTDSHDQRDAVVKEVVQSDEYSDSFFKSPIHINHYFPLELGKPLDYPWKHTEGSIYPAVKLFVALNLLSHQTLAISKPDKPPRASIRRAGRWKPDPGYITVITLRHTRKPTETIGEVKVHWSHRWVVGGHWRRQWYPKIQTHRWKYITEYIKGPEDKPLVVRKKRLFNFRR